MLLLGPLVWGTGLGFVLCCSGEFGGAPRPLPLSAPVAPGMPYPLVVLLFIWFVAGPGVISGFDVPLLP